MALGRGSLTCRGVLAAAIAGAVAFLLAAAPAPASPGDAAVANDGLRFDVDGDAIDAHDGALYSSHGGATWRAENGRDLRFEISVSSGTYDSR